MLRDLWTRLSPAVRRALTFWRRSIQARVVASTVVLSALVVSAVGWILLQQVRQGLLEHRVDVVLGEVDAEMGDARDRLEAASGREVNVGRQQRDLVDPIIDRGASRGYSVVLAGPEGEDIPLREGGGEYTSGLDLVSVPEDMEAHFDGVGRATAWTYTEIVREESGEASSVPGIIVGSQVQLPSDGKTYTLYYLFPLSEEQETLGLVTRALLTAAGLLLALVAGLTWLVTRQVVTPIRLARQIAERLAAGRLQERLQVTGEDDIARLAYSFNQMATSLQRQIRQLEELSWVQRRFVSDVSHELRTPLTTVRMASDLLHDARAGFDPASARAAELLQAELDRFENLLVDLLEISRFDAGAAVLAPEDVNLDDIVNRVVTAAQPLADQRHVRVMVEHPDDPVRAEVDSRRVERILRNLVTNAIDHALADDPTEAVVVRLASDEEAAAITVRDHGVGLAPGEAAMVFNRFWRSDPARARTSGGTGLGLAIAQEDAHLHGGWLQAWGRSGQGAQFRLTLPRRAGATLRHSPLPLIPEDAVSSDAAVVAGPDAVVPVQEVDR
ncbi:two-component sensor histidine kinase [Nocardioides aromaticivorans]|uniref:Sensor histidine kinase MtrB n=1 Tax=Nocardioides aromaticivorans TaxID=200618 RepID=A0ABX7PPB0_9ACTN|nr:MtrAB system histidine kinase MtrB [Nocardioides aromaticivorans]QSR27555.1 two-component sensor histidine kinase [Nocardioides aromaticivorans]